MEMSIVQQMLSEKRARVHKLAKALTEKERWEFEQLILIYCSRTYVSKRKANEYFELLKADGTAIENEDGTFSHRAVIEAQNYIPKEDGKQEGEE